MQQNEQRLTEILEKMPACIVACSGGVDSMLLSHLAHEIMGPRAVIAHCVSPAVQEDSTERVKKIAGENGWNLRVVKTKEFQDENYLKNPVNRCYYCKHNLYEETAVIAEQFAKESKVAPVILNGTNTDDLGEYRPGLEAAKKFSVRFPFVEAGVSKQQIREMARERGLEYADVPGGACLSSRLYTSTRVTPERLKAAYRGENLIREWTGVGVVRCRLKEDDMMIELKAIDQEKFTEADVEKFRGVMMTEFPWIKSIIKDSKPYAPGRSFQLKEIAS